MNEGLKGLERHDQHDQLQNQKFRCFSLNVTVIVFFLTNTNMP